MDIIPASGSSLVATDRNGFVREGSTSNIFLVVKNNLVTPGRGILSGITRRTILDLSKQVCRSEIRDVTRDELYRAEEVFITGSNKGLVPVVQVDDYMVADGQVGPITRSIIGLLKSRTGSAPGNGEGAL